MTSANDIRSLFLGYFKERSHTEIASASLVPENDPTLLFVNSGMVQFKNIFTGVESRDYKRAVTAQKCVRAGGKHNDLENVGYTARHHTFFEMLGNFSFGDYFKDLAIEYAWDLVHGELGLSRDRLLVTVYGDDDEAAALWRKIAGFSEDRIIRISTSDNFWQMGDTGPCGPCSEIFYDHGDSVFGGPPGSADEDGDRFIEIWNLVFMQYEQFESGDRRSLPSPSVDTGMGLERIAAVLQGKHNNYDIDLLRSLIEEIALLSENEADGEHSASHKVIADHLRSVSFLIADGVLPSNEGRGYVLRRIMRRAMRHGHILSRGGEPFLYRLVEKLVDLMGGHFTELVRARSLIEDSLRTEEIRFRDLLERGLVLLEKESSRLGGGGVLPGAVAFTLYDTYGFPLDLTEDILRGRGFSVDRDGFDVCMAEQRAKAREAWSGSGGSATSKVWYDLSSRFGASEFLGYASDSASAMVLALVRDGESVDVLRAGESGEVILSQTPFYAESGGQEGDRGMIRNKEGVCFTVEDTRRRESLHAHIGSVAGDSDSVDNDSSILSVGDEVSTEIDGARRRALRSNHSATHLLHGALRSVLGDGVMQKGSLVSAEGLRFDFSHSRGMSADEIVRVESLVNEQIRFNGSVAVGFMSLQEAMDAGALALFGEKYGDEVRVISMGIASSPVSEKAFSYELCGGTHVERCGDIGYFRIVSESPVGDGTRRIFAETGDIAVMSGRRGDSLLSDLSDLLKSPAGELSVRVSGLLDERKHLRREVEDLRRRLAVGGSDEADSAERIGNIDFVPLVLSGVAAKQLRSIAEARLVRLGSGIVAVFSQDNGKVSAVIAVSEDLTERYDAKELVHGVAEIIGGKGGGGRSDMAQTGGSDPGAISSAVDFVRSAIGNLSRG